RIKGVNLARNFGQQAAVMAGLKYTVGDTVICLDDDGQSPIDGLDLMLGKINEGYDIVFADYFEKKESPFRLFGSKVNELMLNSLLGKPKDIKMNSLFACTRMVVDELLRYENPFPYLPGLFLRTTRNIANVKLTHRERESGESGYTLGKLLSLWINGFTAFSIKPLRAASFIGFFFALLGFVSLIILVISKLSGVNIKLGWTSTVSLIMFFDGMILIVLGLIGEYIGRIYLCINMTPQYVVREYMVNDSLEDKP
ncbi:MAG TPA: glycosyltransferase, partial [Lachnospiraceae bacterium]|nr:glycosyltransferase [Lachnospiraceae bacterium]